jgi:hypothetical protein
MPRRVLFLLLPLVAVPVWAEPFQPEDAVSRSGARAAQVAGQTGDRESREAPRISEEPPLLLEDVLAEIGESGEAAAAAPKIAASVAPRLGRPVSAEELAVRIQDPRSVRELFSVRLPELVEGFSAAQTVPGGPTCATG